MSGLEPVLPCNPVRQPVTEVNGTCPRLYRDPAGNSLPPAASPQPCLWRSWARPRRRSVDLKTHNTTAGRASVGKALRPCWTLPCGEMPKTTPPRVPGGDAGRSLGNSGRGRGGGRQSCQWAIRAAAGEGGVSPCHRGRCCPAGGYGDLEGGWKWKATRLGTVEPQVPLSVLACPLAGPCEGAVMALQGKAGMFHKTAKFGDFRVHGSRVAWGRRKGWQQGSSLGRSRCRSGGDWERMPRAVLLGLAYPEVVSSGRCA